MPLFIHIHMCHRTPVAVLTFLPAVFLPRGARISLDKRFDVELEKDEAKLYQLVEGFLDRFLNASHTQHGHPRHDRNGNDLSQTLKNIPVGKFDRVKEVRWG